MALKKSVETYSGITVEYHRIVDIMLMLTQADLPQIQLHITTAAYVNQTNRVAGKAAVPGAGSGYNYTDGLVVAGTGVNDLKTAAYILLKTHADFADAEDC